MPHRPNSFTGKLIQYKQFDKYIKNCYRTVDQFVRRKKIQTLLKNGVIEGRTNMEKKEKKCRQREKFVGREEIRGGDSESVRREKKTKRGEEVREFIVRKAE